MDVLANCLKMLVRNDNGTKFILLGTARTGSNLLLSLLNTHKAVKAHNEIFNLDALSPDNLNLALTDSVGYIKKRFAMNDTDSAVGFKLFYNHLSFQYFNKPFQECDTNLDLKSRIDELNVLIGAYSRQTIAHNFSKAWEFLEHQKTIKVIHITRANRLNTYVSLKTAYLTNSWMNWKGDEARKTKIKLSRDECESYFTAIEKKEFEFNARFRLHPMIRLTYEDLSTNLQQCADKAFEFLGVPTCSVKTRLKKQIQHPLHEIIENYETLKDQFRNSKWQKFFT